MISQNIAYTVGEKTADGKAFVGYLVFDESHARPRPGILVCHEGGGLNEHARERARMLADLGYVAFALDMFGEAFASREHGIAVITALMNSPDVLRRHAGAALEWLKSHPNVNPSRTAAIGFCFGGLVALELARSGADLCCVVSFHGGLQSIAPHDGTRVSGSVLVCTGADDPFVGPEQRAAFEAEMTAGGVDWQMIVYGGARHGFTNKGIDPAKSPGSAYHRAADERSWRDARPARRDVGGSLRRRPPRRQQL
jgi:dienelactone hydrolase